MESAHANAEASVSGHRLDSGGKSKKWVSKNGNFSKSGRKWDLEHFSEIGMILRLRQNLNLLWNIYAELKLDLEYFLSEDKREEDLDLESFVEKAEGSKGVGLEIFCLSKKGEGK